MSTRKTKAEKQLDVAITESYYRNAKGTSINIMNIPKLYAEVRAAVAAGRDLDQAMIETIARYNETQPV